MPGMNELCTMMFVFLHHGIVRVSGQNPAMTSHARLCGGRTTAIKTKSADGVEISVDVERY